MSFKATYLSAICFTLLFAGISTSSLAQGTLGIIWDTPGDTAEASRQLDIFSKAGISYLELDHPVNSQTLALLNGTGFTVLVRTDKSFLTLQDIRNQQNQLVEDYLVIAERYRSQFNIAGIGLLTHSQNDHPDFSSVFSPILDSLNSQSNKSFYFYINKAWFSFEAPSLPFGKYIYDDQFQTKDLASLQTVFQQEISEAQNTVFFFHSDWFLEAIDRYPELQESLVNFQNSQQWEMPLPKIPGDSISANWIVLLLLLLWAALAAQIKYLPYVRPMMLRYFLAHRFFVDDILHYRERASNGGILLMIKHALFGGIVFYLGSRMLISEAGVHAFFHHLPLLSITGTNYASFFFLGLILILLVQFMGILWLHLPAKSLEHVSQSINLYAGAFYLDFLIVTLMVTFYVAGTGSSLILILAVIFILIWYSTFNIAAFDASRNMGSGSIIYLILTIGLHSISSLAVLIFLLTSTEFIQIVQLAISL